MDNYGLRVLFEENTVIANSETQKARELTAEALHAASACLNISVNSFEDCHGGALIDRADLSWDVWLEKNRLHRSPLAPRICSIVKPH